MLTSYAFNFNKFISIEVMFFEIPNNKNPLKITCSMVTDVGFKNADILIINCKHNSMYHANTHTYLYSNLQLISITQFDFIISINTIDSNKMKSYHYIMSHSAKF